MTTAKIPEGFHTITPNVVIDGAAQAIELYTKSFDAKVDYSMKDPASGKVMHACLQIGTSKIFLCDVMPGMECSQPSMSGFYLYLDDVDTSCRKAKEAGLEETSPPQDMFWGDRTGSFKDKFGLRWTIATHMRDVSQQEIDEAVKKMSQGNKAA